MGKYANLVERQQGGFRPGVTDVGGMGIGLLHGWKMTKDNKHYYLVECQFTIKTYGIDDAEYEAAKIIKKLNPPKEIDFEIHDIRRTLGDSE